MDTKLLPKERIEHLRRAATLNPFDYQTRIASATTLSDFGLVYNDMGWLRAAQVENAHALMIDSTNAQVLQRAILVDLALKDFKEAKLYYEQFAKIDAKSQINQLVAQSHQQGRTPVAAKP